MNHLKKYSVHVVIILFTLFTMLFLVQQSAFASTTQIASSDSLEEFYTNLNGEWYFIHETFTSIEEVKREKENEVGMKIELPGSFEEQTGQKNSYGTYYKKIPINEEFIGQTLAIHIPYQYSAYTLMVDGIEIAKNGKVGKDAKSHESEMAPRTGYFIPQNKEIEILIHVSSFDHIRGGLENEIYLGEAQLVTKKFMTKINFDLLLVSALIIMGFFSLSFILLGRQERGFIVFGLFCFIIATRAVFTDPFYYTVIFSELSWLWGTRIEYILSLLSSWVFVLLLKSWYPKSFSSKVVIFLSVILLSTTVITLFTQPVFFQDLFFKVAILSIPTGIYFLYLTYKEIKLDNALAKINAVGIILIFLAFLNDFAQGINLYQFQPLMLLATASYMLLHIIYMGIRYTKLNKSLKSVNEELVALNTSLDEEVYLRTLELEKANKLLEKKAMLDALTGINNRRSFDQFLREAFMEAVEREQPLSILMLDVDKFKQYNDHFGHRKGDWILQELTDTVQAQLLDRGFFARYGGEEFAVILPNTVEKEACETAEKIRQAIVQQNYLHPGGKGKILTISIGVATLTTPQTYTNEDELVEAADVQLYKAKQVGGNLVM